ncbi:MAG: helix-turn-helix domain-containing protein [Lacibacter sp.]
MQQAIERNEIFDLAFRFITETQETIFLTGKAGTGKTTFLKYLKENCSKNIIVAAPTGVAAINAGGVTLHSLFQLPFQPFLPTPASKQELLSKIRFNKQRLQLLRKMDLLVIDEVSMVRCDVLDAIDTILRSVKHLHNVPFGGVQLLFIGDLFQLPPVAQNYEWTVLQEYYSSTFFFDSMAIKEQLPLLIELTKIYRQKEESFVHLLNKVRNNQMNSDDLDLLNSRYNPLFKPAPEEKYITLTTHNNQADLINHTELQKIISAPFTYTAIIDGDFPENSYPVDESLVLKEGAQVMFLKNDPVARKYFNGKIGTVKKLENDSIVVESGKEEIRVQKEVWENYRYSLNRSSGKLEQELLGTFEQYPLRLAWAITVHKSQGLTFDKIMIDAGKSFASGQVYVALSRCTTLDGIVLLSNVHTSVIFSNEHVINSQKSLAPKGSLPERFEHARRLFTQLLLEDIFSFGQTETSIKQLQQIISKHKHDLTSDAESWIAELINKYETEKPVSSKFIMLINELMKQETVVEKNTLLLKRISDAAVYFLSKIDLIREAVNTHPLVTEHKTVAEEINDQLHAVCTNLFTAHYYLQYCKTAFSVTDFLKHKLNLSVPKFQVSSYAAHKKPTESSIKHADLYFQLKNWRDKICNESNMPIYMLANSASLIEICTYLPFTREHLLQISGFGKAKVDKYGDDILDMIHNYCSEHHIETNIEAKPVHAKRKRKELSETKVNKPASYTVSLQYFKEGNSVEEIAKLRNMAAGTVDGHLATAIKAGELSLADVMDEKKANIMMQAIQQHPDKSLTELKQLLGDNYSYGELRFITSHLQQSSK